MKSKNVLCGLAMAVVLQLGVLAGSAQDAYSTNADGSIYTYSTNADGSANIVAYAGPPWVVTIPTNINGLTVTTIGEYAFEGDNLTNVTIPDSVTSIGAEAFGDCVNLTSVTIPGSVTSIGVVAFTGCSSLTNATIENGVTIIGNAAFQGTALTSVTIPRSVTIIGLEAFNGCNSLTSVYFTGNAPGVNSAFPGDLAIVYYLPGTTGWGTPLFDGLPTAPWFLPNPQILNFEPGFGVQPGGFGFTISWATNVSVVVQATTNLANPVWIPMSTSPLTGGTSYFSDPQWTNYPERFYRAASAFTVGGTLTGLPAGDTVTLHDNGSDNLTLSTNGAFTFPTALPNGQAYSVTVSRTSGGSILTETINTLTNGSGTISGANVTNVAVLCTLFYTGNPDVDMYNAAVEDGTANGGVPAVVYTENGGPFRVTAAGVNSMNVCLIYQGWSTTATTIGNTSCSSTTFPSNTGVIQFGTALVCGGQDQYGY
jgi:hypothetical protein